MSFWIAVLTLRDEGHKKLQKVTKIREASQKVTKSYENGRMPWFVISERAAVGIAVPRAAVQTPNLILDRISRMSDPAHILLILFILSIFSCAVERQRAALRVTRALAFDVLQIWLGVLRF